MKLYRVVFGDVFDDGYFHRRFERFGKCGGTVAQLVNDHCRHYGTCTPQDAHRDPSADPQLWKVWKEYPDRARLRFAFASIEQLKTVFRTKRLRALMTKHGCKVAVFNVDKRKVFMADKQVMVDEKWIDLAKIKYHSLSFVDGSKYEKMHRLRRRKAACVVSQTQKRSAPAL